MPRLEDKILPLAAATGFTGTRESMTAKQLMAIARILSVLQKELLAAGTTREMRHWNYGMCVGADSQAAYLARSAGFWLVGLPPTNRKLICEQPKPDEVKPAMPYNKRNAAIVNRSALMIAATKTNHEVLRSGTWMTIRIARQKETPLLLILPDGTVVQERMDPPLNLLEAI